MKYIVVFIASLIGQVAMAQTSFKVDKVSSSKNRVTISGEGIDSVLAKDNFEFTDEFGEKCYASVSSLEKSQVVLDTSACENKGGILKGSEFVNIGNKRVRRDRKGRKSPQVSPEGHPTLNEDWYALWGLGISIPSYQDDDLKTLSDNLDSSSDVTRTPYNFDFLGFYWPHEGHKSMSGFVLNAVADIYTDNLTDESVSISQYGYSYSYHRFFGANIGDGLFVRGDVGLARFLISNDSTAVGDSKMGLGALAGGGFASNLGVNTRILLGAYLSHRSAKTDNGYHFKANNLNFSVGFLF